MYNSGLTTAWITICFFTMGTLMAQKMACEIQLSALFEGDRFLDSTSYWEGEFDNQIPVSMAIGYLGKEVNGYLHFANSDETYLVRGIKQGHNYHLAEYYEDQFHSANIHLSATDGHLEGSWSNVSISLSASLVLRPIQSKTFVLPKKKIGFGLYAYQNKDNQLISVDEQYGRTYFTLYSAKSAYNYRGPFENSIILHDLSKGQLIKVKSSSQRLKSFELPDQEKISFFKSQDSLWVESSYQSDFFQTIYVNQPLCKTAPNFNLFINSITSNWKSKILESQKSKLREPENRWTNVGQIWFEPYYFENNIISGALYLRSNLIENEVICLTYNLKKDEKIKPSFWLQKEGKLLKSLGLQPNEAQFCLAPKGIMICQPYDVASAQYQQWLPANKVWNHISTKAKLFGLIKRK